ncbi:MAG: hypothetical protein JJE22_03615, partial [Bacteroidia bacterium]|nr:hypothetical protein [Bacteroidia bacterium]
IIYESKLLWVAFPIFTVVYLIVSYYTGLYDRWYKSSKLVRSAVIATIILLAGYSLLPEQYRFSRAIILFSPLLAFLFIFLLRRILLQTKVLPDSKEKEKHANTLIVASQSEYESTVQLMKDAGLQERILGRLAIVEKDASAIGYWKELKVLSPTVPFREVIFCEGALSFKEIIESIQQLPARIHVKFHAANSRSIVGSDSKDSSGEAVTKEKNYKLSDPYNRRLKRLVDFSVAVVFLVTFPVHFFTVKTPISFLANCFYVLFAKKTWIGYAKEEKNLPKLRKGIITCNAIPLSVKQQLPAESLQKFDYWYAGDYEPLKDLRLIVKKYRYLGD